MPPDPQRVSDVRDWLAKARQDLELARLALDADEPLPGGAAFHCQQAAEKGLKAFLYWHDVPFPRTHELEELGRACVGIDASLGEVTEAAESLTPFAWRFRYPGEPSEPALDDVREALRVARDVHEAIAQRLPDEAGP